MYSAGGLVVSLKLKLLLLIRDLVDLRRKQIKKGKLHN
jgi:hypothetical protein